MLAGGIGGRFILGGGERIYAGGGEHADSYWIFLEERELAFLLKG